MSLRGAELCSAAAASLSPKGPTQIPQPWGAQHAAGRLLLLSLLLLLLLLLHGEQKGKRLAAARIVRRRIWGGDDGIDEGGNKSKQYGHTGLPCTGLGGRRAERRVASTTPLSRFPRPCDHSLQVPLCCHNSAVVPNIRTSA
jgi:hypothetical protein